MAHQDDSEECQANSSCECAVCQVTSLVCALAAREDESIDMVVAANIVKFAMANFATDLPFDYLENWWRELLQLREQLINEVNFHEVADKMQTVETSETVN